MLLTQVLQVDPDLVHASGEGAAEDDGRLAVEAEALELGAALLAARRHLAHPDLVAHHLHRLHALRAAPVGDEKGKVRPTALPLFGTYFQKHFIGFKMGIFWTWAQTVQSFPFYVIYEVYAETTMDAIINVCTGWAFTS